MFVSMFWSTFALSTFAQFGVDGTNQLDFAASANGASVGFAAFTFAREGVFGMTPPAVAISVSFAELVYAAIQSAASDLFLLVIGTPRFEPPRNVGMYLPFVWLGIGNAVIESFSAGFPSFGSSAYGHSQPLPINWPTEPLANTSACCGCASSPLLLARESVIAAVFHAFRPASDRFESSVPTHLPPRVAAIWPPKS